MYLRCVLTSNDPAAADSAENRLNQLLGVDFFDGNWDFARASEPETVKGMFMPKKEFDVTVRGMARMGKLEREQHQQKERFRVRQAGRGRAYRHYRPPHQYQPVYQQPYQQYQQPYQQPYQQYQQQYQVYSQQHQQLQQHQPSAGRGRGRGYAAQPPQGGAPK